MPFDIKNYRESDIVELSFIGLHSPMFHNGKGFKERIDQNMYPGVKMYLDRKNDEIQLLWNGVYTAVPRTAVANYTSVGQGEKFRVAPVSHAMVAGISGTAQVETPFGHVHAGPGKGKK